MPIARLLVRRPLPRQFWHIRNCERRYVFSCIEENVLKHNLQPHALRAVGHAKFGVVMCALISSITNM